MKRFLGQHFLKNKEKIRKIIKALEIKNGDVIVEIGPGHGELTSELVIRIQNLEARIITIEKDKDLAEKLQKRFKNYKNIEIVEGDALKILSNSSRFYFLNSEFYKVVGNVPFYITGRLFRIISELEPKPKLCVFIVQKEVAKRVCAEPPQTNLLAAATQFWAEPQIIDFIAKKDSKPAPEVDSAIIKLRIRNRESGTRDNYYKLIKILFKQPRKTILNNLIAVDKSRRSDYKTLLEKNGVNPNDRPQNLSLQTIQKMAEVLYN